MKKLTLITSIILVGLALNTFAAEKAGALDPKMQETIKQYEAAATPGEAHKVLADIKGNWKTVSQMWQTAGGKPETSKGTSSFKTILGDRWLQQEFKGMAMGKSFQGVGMVGYDNVKQKYITNWYDSMSTALTQSEGDFDATTKTFKDKGNMSSPIAPSKTQAFRSEWQMVNKNKMVFSMFGSDPVAGGPEFKMMEIVYTR